MRLPSEPLTGENSFDELLTQGLTAAFEGWDFSNFGGRYHEAECSWDYRAIVEEHLAAANAVLDMGTGGGEFLSSLYNVPPDACATEAYPPNIPVARATLEPLGIAVSEVHDDAALPYANDRFDLVVNRHESFDAREIRRILRPHGLFVTQQVGGRDMAELNEKLGAPPLSYADDLQAAVSTLETEGLRILDQREEMVPAVFHDVGALVLFLRVIEWQVPDFTVDRYRSHLRRLHDQMAGGMPVTVYAHRFLVRATASN